MNIVSEDIKDMLLTAGLGLSFKTNLFVHSDDRDGDEYHEIWWCPCCGTVCIITRGDVNMDVFRPDRTHKQDRQPPKDGGKP